MKTTLKMTTILAGLLTLTACGGGGGSGGGSALLDDPSFDVLAAAFDSSIEAIGLDEDDFELEPESPDTLLVPGSATYTGQIAVLLGDAIDDEDIEDVAVWSDARFCWQ